MRESGHGRDVARGTTRCLGAAFVVGEELP